MDLNDVIGKLSKVFDFSKPHFTYIEEDRHYYVFLVYPAGLSVIWEGHDKAIFDELRSSLEALIYVLNSNNISKIWLNPVYYGSASQSSSQSAYVVFHLLILKGDFQLQLPLLDRLEAEALIKIFNENLEIIKTIKL